MRKVLPRFSVLVLCAGLLAACGSVPNHDEIQTRFDDGLKAYDAGDYQAAYRAWDEIADYDLAALRNIALMLRKGQGVEKDPKAALRKMAQAADLGLVTAQADLGEMLLSGEGTAVDIPDAVVWLGRAAAAGHPLAANALARLYDEGQALPRDLTKACPLYAKAAAAKIADAEARLKAICLPAPEKPTPEPDQH